MKRGFVLNWLTKTFKKVFLDEEPDEKILIEEKELPTYKNSKTPFRFPLISDHEKDQLVDDELVETFEDEPKPLYMHKQWQQQRQNTIVHHASKPNMVKESESQGSEKFKEVKSRTTKIPVQTKTFKPTDVPSPIHGFSRPVPKPINELLANKTPVEVANKPLESIDINATIETTKLHVEPINIKQELIEQNNMLDENHTPITHESVEEVKEEDNNRPKVEPFVSEQVTQDIAPEKKKKSLPFNVMMLNSDKQKYQQKIAQPISSPSITKVLPSDNGKEPQVVPTKVYEEQTIKNEIISENLDSGYLFPNEGYLVPPEEKTQDYEWMQMQGDRLIESLSYFQVIAEIVQMVQGPAVTQFEITVGQGTKVSKIRNLADDLKLALAAKDIRIQAPIPGKSSIGIEIPNQTSRPVRLSEVVGSTDFMDSESPLEAALGLDLTGKPVTIDLRKMPHGLIAGATGSGKSVCINSLLISLLYKATPTELKLLLIDPKMVELAPFNHIPHLVSPVITDVKAATAALKWAVEEMERRYQLFAHTGVRDITRYNTMAEEKRQFAQKMPYLLIVIDELADLMMMAPTEVEESICRIAQKARACGIHLVVATQRPSVDVITGLIKANIPTRIAFSVSSQIDSRTILDVQGAERLLGRGDMLYLGNGMSAPIRIQGTYVTDEEMEEIIEHARSQGEPSYMFEQEELIHRLEVAEDQDELFEEACRFILDQGSASTSLLQRKFHIGYNRAARLVDLMENHGYVSESRGSKAREVFITESDINQLFNV